MAGADEVPHAGGLKGRAEAADPPVGGYHRLGGGGGGFVVAGLDGRGLRPLLQRLHLRLLGRELLCGRRELADVALERAARVVAVHPGEAVVELHLGFDGADPGAGGVEPLAEFPRGGRQAGGNDADGLAVHRLADGQVEKLGRREGRPQVGDFGLQVHQRVRGHLDLIVGQAIGSTGQALGRLGQHEDLGLQLGGLGGECLQLGGGARCLGQRRPGLGLRADGGVQAAPRISQAGAENVPLAGQAGDVVAELGGLGLGHVRIGECLQARTFGHQLCDLRLGAGRRPVRRGGLAENGVEVLCRRVEAGLGDDACPGRSHLVESAPGGADAIVDPTGLLTQAGQLGLAAAQGVLQLVARLDAVDLDLEALELGFHGRDAL